MSLRELAALLAGYGLAARYVPAVDFPYVEVTSARGVTYRLVPGWMTNPNGQQVFTTGELGAASYTAQEWVSRLVR